MFFPPPLDRLPAIVRLGLMMLAVTLGGIATMLVTIRVVLQRDLDNLTRTAVLDDLQEYAAVYVKNDLALVQAMFEHCEHDEQVILCVQSAGGAVLYQKTSSLIAMPDWRQLDEAGLWTANRVAERRLSDNLRLCMGRLALPDGNILYYGRTDLPETRFLNNVTRQLRWAGLVVGLLALLPIFWFSRTIARPIERLVSDARAASSGRQGLRLSAPRAVPELRRFAQAFNDNLDRIETLVTALRSANDQIAHELRTPLSRLKVRLEGMSAGTPSAAGCLRESILEIDRINRLLKAIIDVRAGQNGVIQLNLEPVDTGAMLADIADLYGASAEVAGISLDLRLPARTKPLSVLMDRERMFQVIANLLDNALRFTPAAGLIRINLEEKDGFAHIVISDSGPGLPPELDLWTPFQRGRSGGTASPGAGLGLSLVKLIVEAHGGRCAADNQPSGGAVFTLRLPLHYQTIT